jgi:NAD(P)-dependent dehydrogenase (short-subunit alcohol dehydrogenase family)
MAAHHRGGTVQGILARTAMLVGDSAAIAAALHGAGFRRGTPASLLVNAETAPDLDAVVARCLAFAQALPDGQEGLIVTILTNRSRGLANWQEGATAAGLHNFTRDAALAWGPHRIRVNMIEILSDVPEDDLAATVLLMTRLPSMTGQTIRLGVPRSGSQ